MKHAPRFRNRPNAVTESESTAAATTKTSTPPPSPASTTFGGGTNQSVKVRDDPQRPLRCLETLAQKAGINFDEDFASPSQSPSTKARGSAGTPPIRRRHPLLPLSSSSPRTPKSKTRGYNLEKSQSPAQQVAAATTALQISPEQLQQFYASNPYAIQVKQEFPTHTAGGGSTELKHAANILDVQQQMQLQQQLSDGSGGGGAGGGASGNAGAAGGAPSPANSQQSTAISTMSPMQLAAATGGVGGDWSQGRTVQLMQPSTSFLYPQMIVSGNLLHPSGIGQQPIQVITAGKPFQGNGPQMLTTTTQNAKQMNLGQAGFAGGNYATCIPSNHNQSPQTLLISPVNVISHSPQQQQNLLQSMAAAAQQQQLTQQQQQQLSQQQQQQQLTQQQQQQQQQLTAALAKVGVDAQGKLAQKVVQKVTTTSSTVQAATGPGSAGTTQAQQVQQVQQQQQQTTQTTQQCVQVSQSTLPVGVGAQSVQTAQLLNAGQAQQMQIPWFWQNAAGLQPFGSNQIILRNQPDGTQGMFIQQQPTTQTLQTQQNHYPVQCDPDSDKGTHTTGRTCSQAAAAAGRVDNPDTAAAAGCGHCPVTATAATAHGSSSAAARSPGHASQRNSSASGQLRIHADSPESESAEGQDAQQAAAGATRITHLESGEWSGRGPEQGGWSLDHRAAATTGNESPAGGQRGRQQNGCDEHDGHTYYAAEWTNTSYSHCGWSGQAATATVAADSEAAIPTATNVPAADCCYSDAAAGGSSGAATAATSHPATAGERPAAASGCAATAGGGAGSTAAKGAAAASCPSTGAAAAGAGQCDPANPAGGAQSVHHIPPATAAAATAEPTDSAATAAAGAGTSAGPGASPGAGPGATA
ncbi:polyhomeotic-proximal chromatin protein-like isoform X3 [Drosophila gunungcola]|uniref:polyhomeotic-proximal chromatin protein-like isoform X3 n=1 Tax=Drosophila gunungcola TaxID=103775 RepID=UPI0022E212FB|nr:polyhomeotic-proximal chromatin protein-like isoform X3 [Drosophila gunungcola]